MANILVKQIERLKPMDLYPSEIKLILRLRNLRRQAPMPGVPYALVVTASPMTLSIIGAIEMLESVSSSGSSF